jgi:hypothetical protein
LPKLVARRWNGGVAATFMSMPEAAMHEDNYVVFREKEIGPPKDILDI